MTDEYEFAGQPRLDRGALETLLERFSAERREPAAAASVPPEPWRWPETAYQVAASTPEPERAQPVFRWVSPGGALAARLAVPPTFRGSEDERLCVAFHRAGEAGEPATELAGTEAALVGIVSTIDEQGRAFFAVGELRRQTNPGMTLEVGDPPALWRVQEPCA